MIAIGSAALNHWCHPPADDQSSSDLDFIVTRQELDSWLIHNSRFIKKSYPTLVGDDVQKIMVLIHGDDLPNLEFEIAENGNSAEMIYNAVDSKCMDNPLGAESPLPLSIQPAELPILFAIKKSHLHAPLKKWEKHMRDYHNMVNMLGKDFELTGLPLDIYRTRRKETNERIRSTPHLNVSNGAFFGKARLKVPRVYVHDDIHMVTAYTYGKPIYATIKKDPAKATCDKGMFFELSHQDQLRCVLEEAYTIALERVIIPKEVKKERVDMNVVVDGLTYAVRRICTNLTSGWFRKFAQDHYYELLERAELDDYYGFYARFKKYRSKCRKQEIPAGVAADAMETA